MSTTQLLKESGPLERYGAGPIHFAGSETDLYERHLIFDNVYRRAHGRARSFRGFRSLRPRRAFAALGTDPKHLRAT